jgi:tRNA(Ile)-lysidine synthase
MQKLVAFLKKYHDGTSPLLLALSGGNDSLALLAMLRVVQKIYPFVLHVAHVDHGWRHESRAQAETLRGLITEPFHSIRLEGVEKNENAARQARLSYFRTLQQEHHFQAVMMAHHADDQAETVLKRLFEGAHLSHLSGIKKVIDIEGVTCWRPLLSYTKKELTSYLEHEPLLDSTNDDPTYLRNRMRQEIIPLLEESFGKNVARNLMRLGERASAVDAYFETKLQAYEERILPSPWGLCFDFSGLPVESALEWEWLIKKTKPEDFTNDILPYLITGQADVYLENRWYVDRRRLFWLAAKEPTWQSEIFFEPREERLGWQQVWQGSLALPVPKNFVLAQGEPSMQLHFSPKRLGEWWSEHKVPAWLRARVPVVLVDGKVAVEFLYARERAHDRRDLVHLEMKLV